MADTLIETIKNVDGTFDFVYKSSDGVDFDGIVVFRRKVFRKTIKEIDDEIVVHQSRIDSETEAKVMVDAEKVEAAKL